MHFDLWIPGKPHPKGRPRFAPGGHTYTPKETVDAEKAIAKAYEAAGGPNWLGPVAVYLTFSKDGVDVVMYDEDEIGDPLERSKLRGDLDNYVKTVLDGLQSAKVDGERVFDDRQVVHIVAKKL